ncbi:MAG: hypothetical protein IKB64_00915 [Paludibacteraceae bacterium]|nr:hypothetical protein [Paludibacteraceae bacterium]
MEYPSLSQLQGYLLFYLVFLLIVADTLVVVDIASVVVEPHKDFYNIGYTYCTYDFLLPLLIKL